MSEITSLRQKWRFIDTGNYGGSFNMALDEALLLNFDPRSSQPVFRLYGWTPPAISIGRFQKAEDVLNLQLCNSEGVPVVRRITGGGVIYHADELTYSIVSAPGHLPLADSIKDSFRVLTGFLLEFYRELGLDARYACDSKGAAAMLGVRTSFCFAGRETFDVLINDRKIGGNAQRRLREVIFQHGSIPLVSRFNEGIRFLKVQPPSLEDRVTCLADEMVELDYVLLKSKLKQAFCTNLGAELIEMGPDLAESELVDRLKREKYTNPDWNMGGNFEN